MLWSPFAVVEQLRQIVHQKTLSARKYFRQLNGKQYGNVELNVIVRLFREKVEGLKQSL